MKNRCSLILNLVTNFRFCDNFFVVTQDDSNSTNIHILVLKTFLATSMHLRLTDRFDILNQKNLPVSTLDSKIAFSISFYISQYFINMPVFVDILISIGSNLKIPNLEPPNLQKIEPRTYRTWVWIFKIEPNLPGPNLEPLTFIKNFLYDIH